MLYRVSRRVPYKDLKDWYKEQLPWGANWKDWVWCEASSNKEPGAQTRIYSRGPELLSVIVSGPNGGKTDGRWRYSGGVGVVYRPSVACGS